MNCKTNKQPRCKNQKDNADVIINFVEEKNNLKCNLIIIFKLKLIIL